MAHHRRVTAAVAVAVAVLAAVLCATRPAPAAANTLPVGCVQTGSTLTSCTGFTGSDLDLRSLGLTAIEATAFTSMSGLVTLRLGQNALTELPAGVFDDLQQLYSLDLQSNSLTALPANMLPGFTSLSILNLKSNSISSLPDADIFQDLGTLTTLTLSHNSLTELPSGVFRNLGSVTQLFLEDNLLSSLPAGIFDDMTSLAQLLLQNNLLTSLPSTDIFQTNQQLNYITLRNNKLASVPNGAFNNLPNLQTLDLGINQLRFMPEDLGTLPLIALELTSGNLFGSHCVAGRTGYTLNQHYCILPTGCNVTGTVLESCRLFPGTALNLTHSHLSAVQDSAFAGLSQVTELHLSGNALLTTVTSGGQASWLDDLTGLQVLRLDHNPGLTAGPPAATWAALSGLTELSLAHCSIETLDEGMWASLPALTTLELVGNGWSGSCGIGRPLEQLGQSYCSFPSSACERQGSRVLSCGTELTGTLDLSGLGITELAADALAGLSGVTQLNLDSNALTIAGLSANQFAGMTSLVKLILTRNPLGSLPDGDLFSGLGHLKNLQMQHCSIAAVGTAPLSSLTSLQTLNLGDNMLTEEHLSAMGWGSGANSLLQDISLARNQITTLPSGVFANLTALTHLYVHKNDIATVDALAFSGLGSLLVLDLSGNAFTMLPAGVFSDLGKLFDLTIEHNQQASLALPDTVLLPLRSLTVLKIQYSGLTSLPQLDSMTGLVAAHLRQNQLTELAPLAFANKPQLQWVYLSGNRLTTVPVNCFANCTGLRTLHVEYNELAHLPPDVFGTLHGLIDVRLSYNQLTSVPERLFVNSPLVKHIRLHGNKLESLPLDLFTQLGTLDLVFLNSNRLSLLDEAMFEGVAAPSQVDLSFNAFGSPCSPGRAKYWTDDYYCSMRAGCVTSGTVLTSCSLPADSIPLHFDLSSYGFTAIAEDAFADPGFASVESLSLAGNAITELPQNVFAGMTALKSLNLSSNALTNSTMLYVVHASLPQAVFLPLASLEVLDLRNNRLEGYLTVRGLLNVTIYTSGNQYGSTCEVGQLLKDAEGSSYCRDVESALQHPTALGRAHFAPPFFQLSLNPTDELVSSPLGGLWTLRAQDPSGVWSVVAEAQQRFPGGNVWVPQVTLQEVLAVVGQDANTGDMLVVCALDLLAAGGDSSFRRPRIPFDVVAPVAEIAVPPPARSSSTSAEATLGCSEAGCTFSYSLDGEPWQTLLASTMGTDPSGGGQAGSGGGGSNAVTTVADPQTVVILTAAPPQRTTNTSAVFTFSAVLPQAADADLALDYRVSVDGSAGVMLSSHNTTALLEGGGMLRAHGRDGVLVTGLQPGEHALTVWAAGAEDTQSAASSHAVWTVVAPEALHNRLPPRVVATSPPRWGYCRRPEEAAVAVTQSLCHPFQAARCSTRWRVSLDGGSNVTGWRHGDVPVEPVVLASWWPQQLGDGTGTAARAMALEVQAVSLDGSVSPRMRVQLPQGSLPQVTILSGPPRHASRLAATHDGWHLQWSLSQQHVGLEVDAGVRVEYRLRASRGGGLSDCETAWSVVSGSVGQTAGQLDIAVSACSIEAGELNRTMRVEMRVATNSSGCGGATSGGDIGELVDLFPRLAEQAGVWRSAVAVHTWVETVVPSLPVPNLVVVPPARRRVWSGSDEDLFVWTNGGECVSCSAEYRVLHLGFAPTQDGADSGAGLDSPLPEVPTAVDDDALLQTFSAVGWTQVDAPVAWQRGVASAAPLQAYVPCNIAGLLPDAEAGADIVLQLQVRFCHGATCSSDAARGPVATHSWHLQGVPARGAHKVRLLDTNLPPARGGVGATAIPSVLPTHRMSAVWGSTSAETAASTEYTVCRHSEGQGFTAPSTQQRDGGDGVLWCHDGSSNSSSTTTATAVWTRAASVVLPPLEAGGVYTLFVRARDAAGWVGDEEAVTWQVEEPVVRVVRGPPSVSGHATALLELALPSGLQWVSLKAPWALWLEQYVRIEVDEAANAAPRVSEAPKEVWQRVPASGEVSVGPLPVGQVITFAARARGVCEACSGGEYVGPIVTWQWVVDTSAATSLALHGVSEGPHVLQVRATDPIGNVQTEPPASAEFTVDTTTPNATLELTAPRAGDGAGLVWYSERLAAVEGVPPGSFVTNATQAAWKAMLADRQGSAWQPCDTCTLLYLQQGPLGAPPTVPPRLSVSSMEVATPVLQDGEAVAAVVLPSNFSGWWSITATVQDAVGNTPPEGEWLHRTWKVDLQAPDTTHAQLYLGLPSGDPLVPVAGDSSYMTNSSTITVAVGSPDSDTIGFELTAVGREGGLSEGFESRVWMEASDTEVVWQQAAPAVSAVGQIGPLPSGVFDVYAAARDLLGNKDATPLAALFVVDVRPPSTGLPLVKRNPTNESDVEVFLRQEGEDDGALYAEALSGFRVMVSQQQPDGGWLPMVDAVVAVMATLLNPAARPSTVVLLADVSAVDYAVPLIWRTGSTWLRRLSSGRYKVVVEAIDLTLNVGPARELELVVDMVPPFTVVREAPHGHDARTRLHLVLATTNDAGATFYARVTDSNNREQVISAVAAPEELQAAMWGVELPQGAVVVHAWAVDAAGNTEIRGVDVAWVVDSVPPLMRVTLPDSVASGFSAQTTWQLAVDCADQSTCVMNVTNRGSGEVVIAGALNSVRDGVSVGVDGPAALDLLAWDEAGNTASHSVEWVQDTVPPTLGVKVWLLPGTHSAVVGSDGTARAPGVVSADADVVRAVEVLVEKGEQAVVQGSSNVAGVAAAGTVMVLATVCSDMSGSSCGQVASMQYTTPRELLVCADVEEGGERLLSEEVEEEDDDKDKQADRLQEDNPLLQGNSTGLPTNTAAAVQAATSEFVPAAHQASSSARAEYTASVLAGLPDGTYSLELVGRDAAGHEAVVTVGMAVDTVQPEAPTVTSTQLGEQDATKSPFLVATVTLTNDVSYALAEAVVWATFDGEALLPQKMTSVNVAKGRASVTLALGAIADSLTGGKALSDGGHVLSALVEDAAGNRGPPGELSFDVQSRGPCTELVAWPAAKSARQVATFVVRATQPADPSQSCSNVTVGGKVVVPDATFEARVRPATAWRSVCTGSDKDSVVTPPTADDPFGRCTFEQPLLNGVNENYLIEIRAVNKLGAPSLEPQTYAWRYEECKLEQFAVINATNGAIECLDCPPGAACTGGTLQASEVQAKQGWWAPAGATAQGPSSLRFYACPIEDACLPQREGANGTVVPAGCAEGYTGVLCGLCEPGWFRQFGKCSRCPESREGVWLLMLALFMALLACGLVLYIVRGGLPMDVIKIMVSWCQILAAANTSLKIPWPASFAAFLNLLKIALLDVLALTRTGCATPVDFYTSLLFTLLAFGGGTALAFAAQCVADRRKRGKLLLHHQLQRAVKATAIERKGSSGGRSVGSAAGSGSPRQQRRGGVMASPSFNKRQAEAAAASASSSPRLRSRPRGRRSTITRQEVALKSTRWGRVFKAVFFYWIVCYPGISVKLCQLFRCIEVEGEWWLFEDLSLQCFTGIWGTYALLAVVMLVVFTLGFPLGMAWLLWRSRNSLETKDVKSNLGFLYLMYGNRAYLWGVVELFRNLLLTSVILLFFDTGSAIQVTFALLVSAFVHVAHAQWRPYTSRTARLLQHGSMTVTTLVYALGLLFRVRGLLVDSAATTGVNTTSAGDGDDVVFDSLGIALVVICGGFVAWGGGLIVFSVLKYLRSRYRCRRSKREEIKAGAAPRRRSRQSPAVGQRRPSSHQGRLSRVALPPVGQLANPGSGKERRRSSTTFIGTNPLIAYSPARVRGAKPGGRPSSRPRMSQVQLAALGLDAMGSGVDQGGMPAVAEAEQSSVRQAQRVEAMLPWMSNPLKAGGKRKK